MGPLLVALINTAIRKNKGEPKVRSIKAKITSPTLLMVVFILKQKEGPKSPSSN
jgi:hypothetical protein